MKKIILDLDKTAVVPVGDVDLGSPMFVKKGGVLVGFVVYANDPRQWGVGFCLLLGPASYAKINGDIVLCATLKNCIATYAEYDFFVGD